MVLKDILAISGEPGLFKFIAQGKLAFPDKLRYSNGNSAMSFKSLDTGTIL